MSLDNTLPSARFPSSLVILLNSTRTVLKKEGTDEVQLLANAGIPARPQNSTHTPGQQEGTFPFGTQSWGPKLDPGLSIVHNKELTVTECLLVASHGSRHFPSINMPSSPTALSNKV